MVETVPPPVGAPVRDSRLMRFLVFVATTLFFISAGGTFIVFGQQKSNVNCKATNFPTMLVHRNDDGTAREEEVEDWRVNCTLTLGEAKLFDAPLALAHPTSYEDAMLAIKEFRTKVAPKLIKDHK